jgi:hypothetical protein
MSCDFAIASVGHGFDVFRSRISLSHDGRSFRWTATGGNLACTVPCREYQ